MEVGSRGCSRGLYRGEKEVKDMLSYGKLILFIVVS